MNFVTKNMSSFGLLGEKLEAAIAKKSHTEKQRGVVVGADGDTSQVNLNHIGGTYGSIKVISFHGISPAKNVPMYNCVCTKCGRDVLVPESALSIPGLKCRFCEEAEYSRNPEKYTAKIITPAPAKDEKKEEEVMEAAPVKKVVTGKRKGPKKSAQIVSKKGVFNLKAPHMQKYLADTILVDHCGNSIHSKIDLVGHKFGDLVVVKFYDQGAVTSHRKGLWSYRWLVRCACGNESLRVTSSLIDNEVSNYRSMCKNCRDLSSIKNNKVKAPVPSEEPQVVEPVQIVEAPATASAVESKGIYGIIAETCLNYIKSCTNPEDMYETIELLHGLMPKLRGGNA